MNPYIAKALIQARQDELRRSARRAPTTIDRRPARLRLIDRVGAALARAFRPPTAGIERTIRHAG